MTKLWIVEREILQDTPKLLRVEGSVPTLMGIGVACDEPAKLVFVLSKLKNMPDILSIYPSKAISKRAIAVARQVGESHFQEWPLCLITRKGESDEVSFLTINLLDPVACVDMKKSKVGLDESGNICDVEKLVLEPARVPKDRHLFLIADVRAVAATDTLVEAWKAANITGGRYLRPEEFTR